MRVALLLIGFYCVANVAFATALANCEWNGYDLSSLSASADYTQTVGGTPYRFQICGAVKEDATCQGFKTGASMCWYKPPPPVATAQAALFAWDDTVAWSQVDENDPKQGVAVSFSNGNTCTATGQPIQTSIVFSCGTLSASLPFSTVVKSSNGCVYQFTLPSPAGCTGGSVPSKGGLSGGSIFLIIFFVVGFVYVVAGCIYKRQRMGAAGTEACPNVDFWREVPGLVKDGCAFTLMKIRGCSGGSGSDSSTSYENVK